MKIVLKEVDAQGRIVLQGDVDLTEFFDKAEVDVKSDLSDWHGVKRELRKR